MSDLGSTLVRAIDERDAALKRLAAAERELEDIKRCLNRFLSDCVVADGFGVCVHLGGHSRRFRTDAEAIAAVRVLIGLEPKP